MSQLVSRREFLEIKQKEKDLFKQQLINLVKFQIEHRSIGRWFRENHSEFNVYRISLNSNLDYRSFRFNTRMSLEVSTSPFFVDFDKKLFEVLNSFDVQLLITNQKHEVSPNLIKRLRRQMCQILADHSPLNCYFTDFSSKILLQRGVNIQPLLSMYDNFYDKVLYDVKLT